MIKVNVLDFETEAIGARPNQYPPVPASFSLKLADSRAHKFYSWGHPTGNNCTRSEAGKVLKQLWNSAYPVLMHNAKFDLEVASEHFNLPLLPKAGYHDTLLLAFLHNPHDTSLSLKPLADKYLNMPAEEQDAVREWIMDNHPAAKGKPRKTWKGWGAYICDVPGNIVGKYAKGDTIRTLRLFQYFMKVIKDRGMESAYQRELELLPLLVQSEKDGVRINEKALRRDMSVWQKQLNGLEQYIRRRLKTPDLDIDSNVQMADALEAAGYVEEWEYTEKGNRKTAKDSIMRCVNNNDVLACLGHRSYLAYNLSHFASPWLTMAEHSGGYIHTNWNQVRSSNERTKGFSGARTGRLSSNPNFQNIPKTLPTFDLPAAAKKAMLKASGSESTDLPTMRRYIIPRKGNVLLDRDFAQQELRVMAYFEDGALFDAFKEDPMMDVHEYAQAGVEIQLGYPIGRKPIKTINFGLIYGMGLQLLSERMGVEREVAQEVKQGILRLYDGLPELQRELKLCGKTYPYIKTWGGRTYEVEPPKVVNGVRRTFEYKLLNYLIQGSAADITKQAIINYHKNKHPDAKFILQVHDQLTLDVPKGLKKREMEVLRECMLDVDVGGIPMLSDGSYGSNWADLKPYREPKNWWRECL